MYEFNNNFFKNLSLHAKVLNNNLMLSKIFLQALNELANNNINELTYHFMIIETSYLYQHFGFYMFAPKTRQIIANYLSDATCINILQCLNYLENICYLLLEDFFVLKITSKEPEWEIMDELFFNDLAKRILCANNENDLYLLGLEIFDKNYNNKILQRTKYWIELLSQNIIIDLHNDINIFFAKNDFKLLLVPAFILALEEMAKNPLIILTWRMKFLISFSETKEEARFILRENSEEQEEIASRLVAILVMLLPHRNSEGVMLLAPTPTTQKDLKKILMSDFYSTYFDCTLFRSWIGIKHDEDIDIMLKTLIELAINYGLIFSIPYAKQEAYGLKINSLKILEPYMKDITAILIKEQNSNQQSQNCITSVA